MGLGKSLKKAVKKVTSTVTSVAAGAVGGGGIGATAGLVKGVIANSKTGSAAPITLGSVGTDAAIGLGTNVAAGAIGAGLVALPKIVAGAGAVGSQKTGIISKASKFFKSGGLAGNLGNLANISTNVLSKGGKVFKALIKNEKGEGITPGTDSNASETQNEYSDIANTVREGYRELRANPKVRRGLKDAARSIYEGGTLKGAVETFKETIVPVPSSQNAPTTATLVPDESGGLQKGLMLAAVGLLAFFFVKRRA